jgi:polyphosphate kinase 2 (PPK2 family)
MLQRTDGFDAQSTVSDCTMSKKIDDDLWSLEHETLPEPIAELTFSERGWLYPRQEDQEARNTRSGWRSCRSSWSSCSAGSARTSERVVLVFEGRDAAGKGGTIRRFMLNLNPRYAHVVALSKPSDVEQGQWYFQRYIDHLPTTGDMCFYDRSWYNRAGVERVFGFCTEDQVQDFFMEAPVFEGMLQREGIHLFKFWLTVERAEQLKRFYERKTNPLKQWKLSPIDTKSVASGMTIPRPLPTCSAIPTRPMRHGLCWMQMIRSAPASMPSALSSTRSSMTARTKRTSASWTRTWCGRGWTFSISAAGNGQDLLVLSSPRKRGSSNHQPRTWHDQVNARNTGF